MIRGLSKLSNVKSVSQSLCDGTAGKVVAGGKLRDTAPAARRIDSRLLCIQLPLGQR